MKGHSNIKALDLKLIIFQAKGLYDADVFGKSDPYVKVKVGAQMAQTKVINNDLNPVWVTKKPKGKDQLMSKKLKISVCLKIPWIKKNLKPSY